MTKSTRRSSSVLGVFALFVSTVVVAGLPAADASILTCNNQPVTVNWAAGERPTDGDDVILGTSSANTIYAKGGDDLVCAGGGNDVVYGGPGDDVIFGGTGNDTIRGRIGNDKIYGEGGQDILWAEGGNDFVDGGNHWDRIYGGDGNDSLKGGSYPDFIQGGAGNDVIDGDGGNDKLRGGDGADKIYGDLGDDDIGGEAGDDTLFGEAGGDSLFGGAGNDTLRGDRDRVRTTVFHGNNADWLYGQSGNDKLYGDGGDDYLSGFDGVDSLRGGGGDDRLFGGNGNDHLYGEAGNDTVNVGDGADFGYGGSGDDVGLPWNPGTDSGSGGVGSDLGFGLVVDLNHPLAGRAPERWIDDVVFDATRVRTIVCGNDRKPNRWANLTGGTQLSAEWSIEASATVFRELVIAEDYRSDRHMVSTLGSHPIAPGEDAEVACERFDAFWATAAVLAGSSEAEVRSALEYERYSVAYQEAELLRELARMPFDEVEVSVAAWEAKKREIVDLLNSCADSSISASCTTLGAIREINEGRGISWTPR